jgi:glycosyltransferase involved in cell wall biosynthesis
MDIAILTPSTVPFVMGGAEHLWLGLQRYLNEETPHHCELFKFPSQGGDLSQLLRSYLEPGRFDLAHFDVLLTGKDPAWFVDHRDQRVYMLHKLRGLYDTYHFFNEPEVEEPISPRAREALQDLRRLATDEASTREASRHVESLLRSIDSGDIVPSDVRFPGPFARQVIHLLDDIALSPRKISRYAAISKTVAGRADYFPKGIRAYVAYPPPRLNGFKCAPGEHFFTVSRLDSAKRIDLIIREFRDVDADVNLFIGGVGPALEQLQQVASGDERIVFLGKLTDEQILDFYACSIAVPFVPYDEDYGLITIEAMKSGKPVITLSDSGGVTEFVKSGETGWCVPNKRGSLTKAFREAIKDKARTAEMGQAAKKSVRAITWKEVASVLLGDEVRQDRRTGPRVTSASNASRPRLVIATTMGIYPPRGGGQSRVFHLFAKLAQHYDVTAVCLVAAGEPYSDKIISANFREIRIPKSEAHEAEEAARSKEVNWVPVTDIVAGELVKLTPKFEEVLSSLSSEAAAVSVSGPYLMDVVKRAMPDTPMLFEAQNLEIELKRDILPSNAAGQRLLETVARLECECWQDSPLVFACTARDLASLEAEYGPTNAIQLEVSNGYSPQETRFTSPDERRSLGRALHPTLRKSALFLGSWHGPNLTAIEKILEIAPFFDDVQFLLIGSACLAFKDRSLPENVRLLGTVEDEEKALLLATASVALNPMTEGSGSNLKMLDYFGAGIPVISTAFGARGIDATPGEHFIAAENDELVFALSQFFTSASGFDEMVAKAQRLALEKYSWDAIAADFLTHLDQFFKPKKKAKQRS